MATTTHRLHLNVLLLAVSCLLVAKAARGQATSETNRASSQRGSVNAPTTVQFTTGEQAGALATNPFAVAPMTLDETLTVPFKPSVQSLGELKQRLQSYLVSKDYEMALQYANSGLEVSPKDPQLLTAKAIALVKLHRLPEAVAAYKDLLAAQPDNAKIVCDLAELLLITGQVEEYQALLAKHKSQIDTAYDGVLTKYFSVLEAYQTKNQDEFREVVIQTVAAFPSTTGPVLRGWDFDELLAVISKKSDYRKKSVLTTFVDVLAGKVSRENALKTIKEK